MNLTIHFRNGVPEPIFFTKQLGELKRLLNKKFESSDEEVINVLGHSVNALYSVPTAIYCFLRTTQKSKNEKLTSQISLRRTVEYTISLGGDTDTIASMACALAGAYYGDTGYVKSLINNCEGFEEILQLADHLYAVASKST